MTLCISFIFFAGISNTAEAAVLFDDIVIGGSTNPQIRSSIAAGILEMQRRSAVGDKTAQDILAEGVPPLFQAQEELIKTYNLCKHMGNALGKAMNKENIHVSSVRGITKLTPVKSAFREKTDEVTALKAALTKELLVSDSLRLKVQILNAADGELEKAQKQAHDFQVEIQKLKAKQQEFLTREQTVKTLHEQALDEERAISNQLAIEKQELEQNYLHQIAEFRAEQQVLLTQEFLLREQALKAQHEQELEQERAISKQLAIEKKELKKNHKLQRNALLSEALEAIDKQRKLERLLKITNEKHQETIQELAQELQKALPADYEYFRAEYFRNEEIKRVKSMNRAKARNDRDPEDSSDDESAVKLLSPKLNQVRLDSLQEFQVIEAKLQELCPTNAQDHNQEDLSTAATPELLQWLQDKEAELAKLCSTKGKDT